MILRYYVLWCEDDLEGLLAAIIYLIAFFVFLLLVVRVEEDVDFYLDTIYIYY